jgi:hypothetical protein
MVGIVVHQINSAPGSSVFKASANAGKGSKVVGNFFWRQAFCDGGNKGSCGILDVMQPGNSQSNFSY